MFSFILIGCCDYFGFDCKVLQDSILMLSNACMNDLYYPGFSEVKIP